MTLGFVAVLRSLEIGVALRLSLVISFTLRRRDLEDPRWVMDTNDLKGAFGSTANDNAHYYLLGYYLDKQAKRPGWHKLNVKLGSPGGSLVSMILTHHQPGRGSAGQEGISVAGPTNDPLKAAQADIQTALASPLATLRFRSRRNG